MGVLIFIIVLLIFILSFTNDKINHLKNRSKSTKINAIVVEYRKEKGPMRNDYTKLKYPYVRIELDDEEFIIEKLRYANSAEENLKIGQKVKVFWYGNDLLYWNAYENGIYKYLPSKWKFF